LADIVLVLGESGSGKSTSLQNLDPETTFIINVTGKALPFKGFKAKYSQDKNNYYVANDYAAINKALLTLNEERFNHIKTIVVDDFQYVMSFEYMNRAKETGFGKFTEMGQHVFSIIQLSSKLREGLTVFFLSHSSTDRDEFGNRYTKMKTIGKLLDEKITLEGLFTVVLVAQIDPTNKDQSLKHYFLTQNDGTSTAKSPMGMFDSLKIPNDLNFVLNTLTAYNLGE
jgi:hypothetical protein